MRSDPSGADPGGWIILLEREQHLGERPDVVVLDLAGLRALSPLDPPGE